MQQISIYKDNHFIPTLLETLKHQKEPFSWELFQLAHQYKQATTVDDFHKLQALDHLSNLDFMKHQISAAKTVIQEMNGRAILADEVGLGKTIEAGLILKEYMIRGLVKKALILVPASLTNQWIIELQNKFHIPVTHYRKNYDWSNYPLLIASLDLAKRKEHREKITEIDFDLVIIDEAHRLKNDQTINYKFVQALKKKYCLLLTATPIQNNLMEIFNLISILKPGYLGDRKSFTRKYSKNRDAINNHPYLQKLIKQVMVRNRRQDTLLDNIKRHVHTIWLQFNEEEAQVYTTIENAYKHHASLSKITFLKEFCSSREACYLSIQKSLKDEATSEQLDLLEAIASLPHHTKAQKLVEIIKQIGNEKIIVFTEYRATQYYLQWYLQQFNISSVPFQGSMNKGRKEWMKQLFSESKQVLIATEAGGEGINLQFCHHIINYDLPWNPMRLEQRIGRIHRFGQKNQIQIYNFAIEKTIETHILTLLYEKLSIFEQAIGKLDQILATLQIKNIEDEVKTIMSGTTSEGELRVKMENFTSIINHTNNQIGEKQNG